MASGNFKNHWACPIAWLWLNATPMLGSGISLYLLQSQKKASQKDAAAFPHAKPATKTSLVTKQK